MGQARQSSSRASDYSLCCQNLLLALAKHVLVASLMQEWRSSCAVLYQKNLRANTCRVHHDIASIRPARVHTALYISSARLIPLQCMAQWMLWL